MKVRVTTTIESDVDITIPYYSKNGGFVYKIFSEKECIRVSESDNEIKVLPIGCALTGDFCTAEYFNTSYKKVQTELGKAFIV